MTIMFRLQEIILKRAADLAEALYSMPRQTTAVGNQLASSGPTRGSPPSMSTAAGAASTGFGTYTSQLAAVPASVVDGQWDDGWSHRYPAFTF